VRRAVIGFAAGITTAGALCSVAVAAQNGATVAFTSSRGGSAVYTVGQDGNGEQRLTSTARPAIEGNSSWSPDGTLLVYVCGNYDLCVMNADGSGQTRLTRPDLPWPNAFVYHLSPAWSPDGTRIAFASNRQTFRYDLFVVNADGTGLTRIGGTAGQDSEPSWSPDGRQLVFTSGVSGNGDLYVINADGTGLRRLTATSVSESHPDWASDGLRIAYERSGEVQSDLYVINADGSGRRRLTRTPFDEVEPSWSPDGTQLLFSADPGGNWDVYVTSMPGRRRLTRDPGLDLWPDWQPAPGPVGPFAEGPTEPPQEATEDARVVAAFELWTTKQAGDLTEIGSDSLTVSLRSATAFRKDSGRGRRAVNALHPTSIRGKKLRRLSLRAFADAQVVGREFEAMNVLLMRHKRRAASRHALLALFAVIIWGEDVTAAGKETGLP